MASHAVPDYDPPIEHLCPICRCEYMDPKLTPCGHTFCKDCLQRYVEGLHKGGQTLLEFLCPECHQLCPMPNGVGGLPTNRSTVDIMNAHKRSLRDRDGSQAGQCDVCKETSISSLASLVCEAQDCAADDVRFCEPCARREHSSESNLGHNLIGICRAHGKPLRHFCASSICNKPICFRCHDAEHSGHDVQLYRDVIAEEQLALDSKLELGKKKITELNEQNSEMLKIVHDDTLSVQNLNSNLAKGIEHAIRSNKLAIKANEADILVRDKQIRDNIDQNRRLGRLKGNLSQRIEVEHGNKLTAIESSLSEIEFAKKQVTAVIQRGEVFINEGIPLKADLRDDIRGTSKQLQKELESAQKDWATPHLQSKNFDVGGVHELLREFLDGVNIDRVNVERERMAMIAEAGLEYFAKDQNLEPDIYDLCRVEIPESGCKCDDDKTGACLVEVKSVVLMSKDRMAVCCVTGSPEVEVKKKRQIVWLWDNYTTAAQATTIFSDDAKGVEYEYMAKLSDHELVLLRRINPVILILNVNARTTTQRKLSVKMEKDKINGLWQIDVDNDGHFLLTYMKGEQNIIALVDNDGNVIHNCDGHHYCEQLAFSRMTREIITCSYYDYSISVYGIRGKGSEKRIVRQGAFEYVLETPSSSDEEQPLRATPEGPTPTGRALGEKRSPTFVCTDICSGSKGDIFIVGRMRSNTKVKRVYRIEFPNDPNDKVVLGKELFEMESNTDPRCAIYNNRLVISDAHKLRLFFLK